VNCSTCKHTRSVPIYTTIRGHDRKYIGERKICTHPLQKSPTPWICRGEVLLKGTPEYPEVFGDCPLCLDLGFC
jgi:hypothetical protein